MGKPLLKDLRELSLARVVVVLTALSVVCVAAFNPSRFILGWMALFLVPTVRGFDHAILQLPDPWNLIAWVCVPFGLLTTLLWSGVRAWDHGSRLGSAVFAGLTVGGIWVGRWMLAQPSGSFLYN